MSCAGAVLVTVAISVPITAVVTMVLWFMHDEYSRRWK